MGNARRITQPGPVAEERIVSAVGSLTVLDFFLEPGLTINAAIAGPLLEAGMSAAQVELAGGALGPFTYVMPATATDDSHVAWYSAAHTPAGTTAFARGNATFGRRDGGPFIHCHAFWTEADGRRGAGHIMPHDTVVAAPIRARAYASAEVETGTEFDPETNFPLFTPRALAAPMGSGPRIAFARVRPNTELCHAVEDICRRHGFAGGRVRGGVGSIIGARFQDAPPVEDYATEVFITSGTIAPAADSAMVADISLALVGYTGVMMEGRLVHGDNPVLITFELAVEEAAR